MKCELLNPLEQFKIVERIQSGDKDAVFLLIDELQRLGSVIKDYEIAMNPIIRITESETFKKPKEAKNPIQ